MMGLGTHINKLSCMFLGIGLLLLLPTLLRILQELCPDLPKKCPPCNSRYGATEPIN